MQAVRLTHARAEMSPRVIASSNASHDTTTSAAVMYICSNDAVTTRSVGISSRKSRACTSGVSNVSAAFLNTAQ